MALVDRIAEDNTRVFMNMEQFASLHTWNGIPLQCVTDTETALKRKNNNVSDISWDNNTTEMIVYAPVKGFPGRVQPNEMVVFDNKQQRILQVSEDMGMYQILLVSNLPKDVAYR